MKYFFSLRIEAEQEQVFKINDILGIKSNYPEVSWGYKLKTKNQSYTNFVDSFLKVLDGKYDDLQKIGIKRENISIWMIYEYEEQCNMEFSPKELKKLGENEITFCISCFKKSG